MRSIHTLPLCLGLASALLLVDVGTGYTCGFGGPRLEVEQYLVLMPNAGESDTAKALTKERTFWWDPVPFFGEDEPVAAGFMSYRHPYAVSPDGRLLAYSHEESGALHVRDGDGEEVEVKNVRHDAYRFSANGRRLAALVATSGKTKVIVVDFDTGERRTLATFKEATSLAWVKDGVVVERPVDKKGTRGLTYVPFAGKPVVLTAKKPVDRFAAAALGTRVVYFSSGSIYDVDVTKPDAKARHLGTSADAVMGAEMTMDGARVAYTTPVAVHLIEGDSKPRKVERREGIHSFGFSRDGRVLAYASATGAVAFVDGKITRRFKAKGKNLRMMRFERGGSLVISRGAEALTWDPDGGATEVLAKVGGGEQLDGAELFLGGVVLWKSRFIDDEPKAKSKAKKKKSKA